jgi:signal transduction histidine kinase
MSGSEARHVAVPAPVPAPAASPDHLDAAGGGERELSREYASALSAYIRTRTEDALYRASLLSQRFVHTGLGPEDIIALHAGALETATQGLSFREQAHASTDALQFLLEVMIAYGINHREYLELKVKERTRESDERLARERSRADEAERLARERAELLQVVAHELRTPLAVVKGSLDLTRRALARGQLDSLERMANQALEAVHRLTRMTNDLVEAGRGTAGPAELVPLDLRPIITQAYTWATTALDKQLQLSYDREGEPVPVLGDPDGLVSVVTNLLSNAIRYTPEGGAIAVACGRADGEAWLEVADSGIGMSQETQQRIFDQFYRAPEAYERDRRGLGLGLSLADQLVRAHNGRIVVASEPGKGSTFRVILPLLDTEAPSGSAAQPARAT